MHIDLAPKTTIAFLQHIQSAFKGWFHDIIEEMSNSQQAYHTKIHIEDIITLSLLESRLYINQILS